MRVCCNIDLCGASYLLRGLFDKIWHIFDSTPFCGWIDKLRSSDEIVSTYKQGYHLSKTKNKHTVVNRSFRRKFKIFIPNYNLLFGDHVPFHPKRRCNTRFVAATCVAGLLFLCRSTIYFSKNFKVFLKQAGDRHAARGPCKSNFQDKISTQLNNKLKS